MKIVSIDIETTGLNPETCQTLQIGAVVYDSEKPKEEWVTFNRVICHKSIRGEPYALHMNASILKGISQLEKVDNPHPLGVFEYQAATSFEDFLIGQRLDPRRFTAAGKNFASFDLQFLKRLSGWEKLINCRSRVVDPAMCFWDPEADGEKLPDLKTCKQRAGFEETEVSHDAVDDAMDVALLIDYLVKNKKMFVQGEAPSG